MPIHEPLIRMTPVRFIAALLAIVFATEAAIMLVLPVMVSTPLSRPVAAGVDASLLVVILAPVVWWMIIRPMQSSAVSEQQRATRLVAILEATPDLVSIADLEGRLVYLNRAGRKMLGIDELADLTRYNLREFHDAADVQVVLTEGIPTAMRDGAWSGETEIVPLDGRAIAVSQVILAHKAPNGSVAFLSTVARDITEPKRAEESVRKSEARYRAVAESASVAIITVDSEGNIVGWNPAAESIFGYTAAEIIGQPLTLLMPHRYRERHLSRMNRIRSGEEPDLPDTTVELAGLRKNQIEFPLELSVARWETASEGWFVNFIIREITQRKQTEEALRRSLDLLDQTGQVAKVGGWELDLDTQTLTWTGQVYRIHEVDPAIKPTVAEAIQFYAPEARPVITAAVQAAIDAGTPFDLALPLITAQGRHIWVRALGAAERRDGQTTRLYGTFQDITEHRVANESRRLQSAALNAAADAILITDRAGVIEWVNPAFTRLTGYTAEDALGKNPRDLVKSGKHAPAFYKELWETLLAGRTWDGEMINRRKDGSLYTEEQTITPIRDASGAITHFVAIKKDMTERVQLEAQFRQAQKMEGVGQLASGIAHDFNNLLTVINGTSDLVLAQVSQGDPVHADVQEILHAGERAAALTRQLLAFSRQQILESRVVSLNTLVGGMESLLRRVLGEDIDLVVVPAPGVGHVKVDPGQIEQVITNLAVNARDAMPQGGRLTIETQTVTTDRAYARQLGMTMPPGSYVLLVVSDSGAGMDEATRARVFEPFFTTKGPGKGTGLGLSTVYGIVKQSHGFIWVYSEVGQGTSFKIYLPRVTEVADTDHPTPTVVSSSGAGTETILLAEDNAGLRKLVTRVLVPAGYTVLEAATGDEALRLVERHEAPVHLLLSDVVMPGLSGRQLAEQLAQTRPGMKVLYMSGYTNDTIVRHGVLEAQMPFLNKPFTAAALLRKVREVLDSTPARSDDPRR